MSSPARCRGATLVELIVTIVVIAAAVFGAIALTSATATRSADTMVEVQAVVIGEAYLNEILQKPFGSDCGPCTRLQMDKVGDYNGLVDVGVQRCDRHPGDKSRQLHRAGDCRQQCPGCGTRGARRAIGAGHRDGDRTQRPERCAQRISDAVPMSRRSPRAAGFTLVELIVVIVVTAIVASFMVLFLDAPMQSYFAQTRRSDLVDSANRITRAVTADARTALPNSMRVNPARTALELLATTGVARYYGQGDKAVRRRRRRPERS